MELLKEIYNTNDVEVQVGAASTKAATGNVQLNKYVIIRYKCTDYGFRFSNSGSTAKLANTVLRDTKVTCRSRSPIFSPTVAECSNLPQLELWSRT